MFKIRICVTLRKYSKRDPEIEVGMYGISYDNDIVWQLHFVLKEYQHEMLPQAFETHARTIAREVPDKFLFPVEYAKIEAFEIKETNNIETNYRPFYDDSEKYIKLISERIQLELKLNNETN